MRFYIPLAIMLGMTLAQPEAAAEVESEEVKLIDTVQCDSTIENCSLKEEYGITRGVERNVKVMGAQAWMRAFSGTHLFVFLP